MSAIVVLPNDGTVTYTIGNTPPAAPLVVNFPFFFPTEIKVTKVVGSTETVLVSGVHYEVTGNIADDGFHSGWVEMLTAEINCKIRIDRNLRIDKSSNFPENGPISIPGMNTLFSRLMSMIQDLTRRISDAEADITALQIQLDALEQFVYNLVLTGGQGADFTLEMFGGKPLPGFDNRQAFLDAAAMSRSIGGMTLRLRAGTYFTTGVSTNFTDVQIIGDGRLATRVEALTAMQNYIFRFATGPGNLPAGNSTLRYLELSGWFDGTEPENYCDYGVVFEGGANSVEGCRVYRFKKRGIWAKRGNNFMVSDSQCGLIPEGENIFAGGIDQGAKTPSEISWADGLLKIVFPAPIVHTLSGNRHDIFFLYGNVNPALNNRYAADDSTIVRTDTVYTPMPVDPGPITLAGTIFTQAKAAGSSISETRYDRVENYSGSSQAFLYQGIEDETFWADGILTSEVRDGDALQPEDPDPPHGFVPGDRLVYRGWIPTSINGTHIALEGTQDHTIVVAEATDPVTITQWGTISLVYGGVGFGFGTSNGATKMDNCGSGGMQYGIRVYDDVGLSIFPDPWPDQGPYLPATRKGGFGDYRGTGFLLLNNCNTGVNEIAGCALECNANSFRATGQTSFSAPGVNGVGLLIDSTIATVMMQGTGNHWCGAAGIRVLDCRALIIQNHLIREISDTVFKAHGNGIEFVNGNCKAQLMGLYVDPAMRLEIGANNPRKMDYGVVLMPDVPGVTAFTGDVEIRNSVFKNQEIAPTANLSSAGTLTVFGEEDGEGNTFYVPTATTAPQFAAYAATYDTLVLSGPLSNVWTETCDLNGLDGKTFISDYGGNTYSGATNDPLISSSADVWLEYDGKNMEFMGTWWIKSTQDPPNPYSTCIQMNDGVIDTHWGKFMPDSWGICRMAVNGNFHGILTDIFEPIDCLTYGFLVYSHNGSDSTQYIIDGWCEAQRCEDTFVCYSMGPGVGSTGSMGLHVRGGIVYGALNAFHPWPNNPFKSIVHSAGVTTFETTFPHGLREGFEFTASGTTPSSYNATTALPWVTIAGTVGTTLKVATADFGPVTVLGSFLAQSFAGGTFGNMPRSMHFEEFQRRGGVGHSFNIEAGTNISFTNCKSDGTTYLMNEITAASYAGGQFRWDTLRPHGVTVGEKFRTFGITTAAYNSAASPNEWVAAPGTTDKVLFAVGADPGVSPAVLPIAGDPAYPAQTAFLWHGWRYGPNFTGATNLRGCQGYDHHGAGFYSEATLANEINIVASQFSNNSSDVNPAIPARNSYNLYDGLYFAPGSQRVHLSSVVAGTGEHYRRANALMTFVSQPADTATITMNGQVIRFMTTPVQAFDIARGANVAEALANLIAFMNVSPYFNGIVVRAEGTNAYRLYRATGGADANLGVYTLASSSAAITFSSAALTGGSVGGQQRYGVSGIADGVRNCTIDRTCNFRGNVTAEMSGAVFPGYVVDVYTVPGSWTFPGYPGVKNYEFLAWGAGAGGGSGRQGAAGAARAAGTAGGGTVPTRRLIKAAEVALPINVTVGAGGTGGAAQAVASTDGNTGTDGGDSWVGGTAGSKAGGYLFARGGQRGGGGTAVASNGSNMVGTSTGQLPGVVQTNGRRFGGGVSITAAPSVVASHDDVMGAGPGGLGGTLSAANVDLGAAQAAWATWADPAGIEPSAAAAAGVNGQDGASSSLPDIGGNGGGGGGAGVASAAGRGGHGGVGSGGGSGGASLNGFASGAGGNGGPGKVTIYSNF